MHHLIFDFDGVIADTYEVAKFAHTEIRDKNKDSGVFVSLDQYSATKPNHSRNHILTTDEMLGLKSKVNEFGHILKRQGFDLFDDFVDKIRDLGVQNQAVVSSGSQSYILPALEKTGLEFTHVLAFEDHHSKEEKIELICRDWEIEVTEVYYFTDTLADIYELRDILHPEKLIAVSWGYCTKEQLLTELSPENILNTASDLPKVLNR